MGLSNKFDSNIYIEPDGSRWVRICHHNNPYTNGIFAHHTDAEWNAGVYGTEHKWFDLGILNDISGTWELMVKQASASGGAEQKWRWTQNYNPNTTTAWATAQPGTVTINTSTGYQPSSMGGLYRMNSSARMCIANTSSGNWFGAFGSWTPYSSGKVPAYPNTDIQTGYMDLYVRVDTLLQDPSEKGLQVWLPLNGNLDNKGFSNVVATAGGATVNSAGKIGACYSFDGSDDYISIGGDCLYDIIKGGSQPFTVAMWVYRADATRGVLFGDYGLPGGTLTNIMELTTSHTVRFYWKEGSGPDKTFTGPLTANAWNHITLTYDGSKVIYYLNGVQKDSYSGTLATLAKTTGVYYLGRDYRTGTTAFNGRMNDFRIYNYALSAKEVKEISKALVLHYKLDDPGIGKDNLLSSYDTSFLSFALGSITLFNNQMAGGAQEIVSGIGGATKCLHLHSNGGNNRQYGTLNCYAGNSYTISCDYYSSVAQSASFRGEMNGGDYTWTGSNAPAYTTPNQWVRLSFSYAALTSNATLYYFMMCTQGTDCYIKNIKIEKGLTSSPWVPAGQGGRLVAYDSSGFGYNGSLMDGRTIDITSDTPRYAYSTTFPRFGDGGQCLDMTHTVLLPTITSGTVVWWVKYTSTQNLLLTGNNDIHYYLAASQNNAYYNSRITVSKWYVDGLPVSSAPKPATGAWHMYAVTGVDFTGWNTFRINRYDGSNAWSLNGSLSDFRIYNSTLSDADILELYQTSASIDKNGNYYTRELVE